MSEPVTTKAEQSTASPANAAPDVREARRQEIGKHPDFWKDGPQTKALRAQMARPAASPEAVVAEDQKKADAAGKLPARKACGLEEALRHFGMI